MYEGSFSRRISLPGRLPLSNPALPRFQRGTGAGGRNGPPAAPAALGHQGPAGRRNGDHRRPGGASAIEASQYGGASEPAGKAGVRRARGQRAGSPPGDRSSDAFWRRHSAKALHRASPGTGDRRATARQGPAFDCASARRQKEERGMTNKKHAHSRAQELGDFTTDWRVIPISLLAIAIGLISSVVAWALLRLIGLFTNLFYYHRWNTALVSPAGNSLGWWAVLVPVAGALVIGLMARYCSERIWGQGIPEALGSIT